MMTQSDLLAARVLSAVPAASYEMTALLSVLRIEATTEVPTACVSCARRPVLRINPEFVDTWCRTDEHLFVLIMHELHHVLLGHTRLFSRITPAHNVAFDAVINALLCRRFPNRAYTSFFSSFYADAEGPARLLAPPDGRPWPPADPLGALHESLYGASSVSAAEVFEHIVRLVTDDAPGVTLLGDHEGNEASSSQMRDVASALASVAGEWPELAGQQAGAGWDLTRTRVDAAPVERRVLAVVRRALLAAASGVGGVLRTRTAARTLPTPLPNVRDRRALVVRAAGAVPLFYATPLTDRTRDREGRAAVYVDVSGSMSVHMPALYGALQALRRHVQPRVHLFSTEVHTVPLRDLLDGARLTTYGNELDPVLDHLLREAPPRALWITDGMVGTASAAMRERFRRRPVDLRVLLLPGGARHDLAGFASRFDELPVI